jgi:outer membrane biosynthesis protein TonB
MNKFADKRVLPDISDLKGETLDTVVVVQILVGTDGDIRCARVQQGDPDLTQRSLDAGQKWQYRPYLLNGEKVMVETWIRFNYTKDNVEVYVPDR